MPAAGEHPRRGPVDPAELNYPEGLPVVSARAEILAALRTHQVVVIAGETGSGKTTQIPKMCLEVGRQSVGHTQPRRIAARSVAERVAEELRVGLGDLVGYQVRFTDQSSRHTRLKVMTDGILLAELQRDRDLRRYDTVIIDEAHERSLNIDFLLGYLKALLPRRPDLLVVVTSATIDPERFVRHFGTDEQGRVVREVPIIEVSGRTYPVEVRYRPLVDRDRDGRILGDERDQVTGICRAVEELWTETPADPSATDILVFLSGEREIRDAAEALAALDLPRTEVVPLFARLSAAEQHRVFQRGSHRRVVLATNVAETSLTVPGVGYVVDAGTARISRYSQRTKVQRLPIEPVSQASAAQRAGRCGRVAPGVAIRLYAEEDLLARPEFTEPEILRTSLASVILQMTALGLGDVLRFPFVDPPDPRQVADGVRLLEELRAFSTDDGTTRGRHRGRGRRLTAYGRTLARLPLDPRYGRMLIEAGRLGCTREVLPIVAALSIQDPRERPLGQETQADQQHARFRHEGSDFATLHRLWTYVRSEQKARSGSAFRRMCKAEYLHYLRVREWQDLHAQLRQACKAVHIDPDRATASGGREPDWDRVHQALLSGLLSHVGVRDPEKREFAGARGARFAVAPGSVLFRKQPDVVMSAELVETTRLWARTNAAIDPLWAEEAGSHVVSRSVSEPRWSRSQGAVVATERVTLYGVPLVADRTVQYARYAPDEARALFIQHALVEGGWNTHHAFWAANERLLARVGELEERARRRDIVADDAVLYAFYDARLPPDVVSARHFDRWWKGEHRVRPDLLTFTEGLLTGGGRGVSAEEYPTRWRQGDLELTVSYTFAPGTAEDGVSIHIPSAVLNQVRDEGFDWQVPGLRADLVVALLKSLPKATRTRLVPVPDRAAATLPALDLSSGRSLTDELTRVLAEQTGVQVGAQDWDWAKVPGHLRVTFVVDDERGRPVARGKDLEALRERSRPAVQRRMARAGAELERTGLTTWPGGTVPEEFEARTGGHLVRGFPALVDEGASVALRVLPDRGEARAAHRGGVRRLLLLGTSPPWSRVLSRLTNEEKLVLATSPHGSVPALLEDCLAAAVDALVAERVAGEVRDEEAYAAALAAVRTHVATKVLAVVRDVEPLLVLAGEVRARLDRLGTGVPAEADVRAQLDSLLGPGFVAATGASRLADLRRYLRAMTHRLERAAGNPREPVLQETIDGVEGAYADLLDALPPGRRRSPEVVDVGWAIEELRVQLFAQGLGTAYPVSEKRVRALIAGLRATA